MPGASTPKRIGRGYPRDLEAGPFQPMIDSWDLGGAQPVEVTTH